MAQLLPPATTHASLPALSRKAKAAIVVRLLLNEGAEIPLEDLPEGLQEQLTQQMGVMRTVDRTTLAAVVDEFSDELEQIGLSFPHGMAGALDALEGKISPQTAMRLRKEAGVRQSGDPWKRIKAQESEALLPILESESVEVAAVMLAKLDIPKAAELLGMLPGQKARSITYAVSQTGAVTPDAVDRIGLSLASQLDDQPVLAFASGPVERVGEILNSSVAATRDDVLSGLDETDAAFAELVRRAIFTFKNIPERIEPRDLPKILRKVDQAQVVSALAYAKASGQQDIAEFILSGLSGRMADGIREEIEEAGDVKAKVGEPAIAEIIAVIRQMEAEQEIVFVQSEEEED